MSDRGRPERKSLVGVERGLGYTGMQSFMRLPYTHDIDGTDMVIVGVPFDLGSINRPGSRYGPRAIREGSIHMTSFGAVYPWDYDLTDEFEIVDYGDIRVVPTTNAIDYMISNTERVAASVFAVGASLLTLGGDHTIPYGPIRAAAAQYGPLALIQIDAHQDTHDSQSSTSLTMLNHGTFATDMVREGHVDVNRSSQVYIRSYMPQPPMGDYQVIDAELAHDLGTAEVARRVIEHAGSGPVYISFDIDGVDCAYAPGTGGPTPGGPSSLEVRRVLRAFAGLDIVACDLVEVNPLYDPTEITATLGATVALDLLYLMAHARSQRKASMTG